MHQRARTPTTRCYTRREIGPVDLEDEVSQCAMDAADRIKEEGPEVMPTAIPNPSETGGVEAMKTGKRNPPRNVGTVARKATGRASAGKNALIRREPVPDIPTKEIGSVRTMLKDPEKPERVCLRDETRRKLDEEDHPEVG